VSASQTTLAPEIAATEARFRATFAATGHPPPGVKYSDVHRITVSDAVRPKPTDRRLLWRRTAIETGPAAYKASPAPVTATNNEKRARDMPPSRVMVPFRAMPPLTVSNFLIVIATVLVTAAVYWPSTSALWAYWTDPTLDMHYGLLVMFLSLWLLCRLRRPLAEAPLRPSLWAIPAVLVCSAGSLIFWRAGIQSLQLLLLPALVLATLVAAVGLRAARLAAVPVGYLCFAMPGWGYLAPPLQDLTARAIGLLLPVFGIPVRLSGYVVSLPRGYTFEITSACSGIHFLVVGLAVAALIGELEGGSFARRAAFLLAMGVAAIASNWARAMIIIAIGYSTGMRHVWATRDHVLFGWVLFAAVLIAFVWLAPRAAPPALPRMQPTEDRITPAPGRLARSLPAVATALVFIPAAVYAAAALMPAHASLARVAALPANAVWRGPTLATDAQWRPSFVGPHSEWHLRYEDPAHERAIEVVAIGYPRQEQGRELVNYGNSLLGQGGLVMLRARVASFDGRSYREWEVADRLGRRSLIWSVYDIGGRTFATPFYEQLWYGIRAFGRPPYSLLFAFRAPCESSCASARGSLGMFLRTLGTDFFAAGFIPGSAHS